MKKPRHQLPQIDNDALHLFEAPNPTGTPERNMLMAVLERAVLDYVGNDKKEVLDAEDWLFATEELPCRLFSFQWICQQFDLDPTRIARIVQAMPKRGSSRIAPWYFMRAAG